MIEFAMLLPLLLLITFGIIGFGYAYNQQVSLQAAVREGARELALRHSPSEVEDAVRNAAPSVDIDSITMTGCPDPGEEGEASVTASDEYDLPLPFFPFLDGRTLTATGVMRCGL